MTVYYLLSRFRAAWQLIAFSLLVCAHVGFARVDTRKADKDTTRPELEVLPTTGPLTAAQIGSGVWWRPELNETSVTQVLDDMQKWEMRNLYLESFWGGKTIYPSGTFDPRAEDGKDWLEHICNEAGKRNIRVIAWVHALYWHYDIDENTTPSLLSFHPDWMETDKDGAVRTAKDPSVFVSPALPQVRAHLVELVDELCARPIDGINLDYIRYNAAGDFGYNPAAAEEFQSLTGIDPRKLKEDDDRDSDWIKWVEYREDLVTSVVHELSFRTREAGIKRGKRLLVTSAYFPESIEDRGKNRKYQNWRQWVQHGYLDVSNPMCYSTSLSGLEKELRGVRSVHQGSSVACVPALAVGQLLSPHPAYVDQRKVLEGVGFRHAIVFKYETLKAELEVSQAENTKEKKQD